MTEAFPLDQTTFKSFPKLSNQLSKVVSSKCELDEVKLEHGFQISYGITKRPVFD